MRNNFDVIRETLLSDASQLITARQSGLATADRIYGLSFTLLTAGLGLFASNFAHRSLLLPLPFLLCLLLMYQAQVSADVKAIGIYRAYLEDSINQTLGERVLGYENGAARARSGRFSLDVKYSAAVLACGIVYLAIAFGHLCIQLYGWKSGQFLTYVVATAAGLAGVIIAGVSEKQSRSKAHGLLNRYLTTGEGLLSAYPPRSSMS